MSNSSLPNNCQSLQSHDPNFVGAGNVMATSGPLGYREGIGDTSIRSHTSISSRSATSTQAYHLPNRRTTFRDKLMCCRRPIPAMRLSKTLDQESISRGEDSSPFWKPSLEETYQKLWLPTKTDLLDLDSTCSNTSLIAATCPLQLCHLMTSKKLSTNLQPTSYRSLLFSQPDTMDLEPIQFCRKIRFYPNLEQTVLLNKCIGGSRFFYNKAVSVLKEKGVKGLLKLESLRPLVMKSDRDILEGDSMEWQKEIPYDTRQEAIADAITAYKGCLTKKQRGQINHFDVSFKSKKRATSQAFRVNKKTLNGLTFFTQRLTKQTKKETKKESTRRQKKKNIRLRKRDKVKFFDNGVTDGNFIIMKTRPSYWYLCLPRTKEPPVFDNTVYKSVFLDPGVRTFETLYSPDGVCGKIDGRKEDLKKLSDQHDQLWSLSSQSPTALKTKKSLRERCAKLRNKIKNIVNDLHWQTCSFLCTTFQNIFIPQFEVSKMVKGSPLGSSVTRNMLQLSHGKFRERLMYYAKTRHRSLYIVQEQYTTKTCGACGHIQEMGGNKTFNCNNCHIKIDRDYNGARNICLKLIGPFV